MADDSVSATTVINAPAEAIFAVLADPAKHAAIDGTGWVREALDSKPLTAAAAGRRWTGCWGRRFGEWSGQTGGQPTAGSRPSSGPCVGPI